ncbi:MAG TPA: biotin/lipoyl-containing protein [bacterium]|nr:biotin/lipoyl-containing protein [bacterium]
MTYLVCGPGGNLQVELTELTRGRYRVRIAPEGQRGKEYHVGWSAAFARSYWNLEWGGRRLMIVVEREVEDLGITIGADHLDLRVDPVRRPGRHEGEARLSRGTVEVRAPMPGLIVAVEVAPGEAISEGMTVAVIEAMKMQMELRAPVGGIVRHLRVVAGQEVAAGDVIAVLGAGGEGAGGP